MLDQVLPPWEPPEAAPKEEASRPDPAVEAVFSSLTSAKAIVLAVSGGPDSMALMLMAADWAKTGLSPQLFVATVDHGMRPESRREAETVAIWAKALGLPHRLLSWEGDKPKTRIQERARTARYGLLCAYAADVGADYVATAHHADDQAETILFRLLRGSGLKGLAGMAAANRRGEMTLARPLLDWTKADLVALCEDRKQAFFEDPSNQNPAYARTRLRRLSGVLAENGLDREALLRLGKRMSRADAALQARAKALVAQLSNLAELPDFEADILPLRPEPEEILSRIIEIQIRTLSSKDVILRLDRLESVAGRLHDALTRQVPYATTLGGMTLNLDQKAHLSIRREPSRRRGRKDV